MRRSGKILPWILRAAGLCALLAVSGCWLITNPVLVDLDAIEAPAADSDRLEADVRDLATRTPSRTSRNVAALDAVVSAWLAGPPSVVFLPPGVARALAGAAAASPNNTHIALLVDSRQGCGGGVILTDAGNRCSAVIEFYCNSLK